MSDAAAWKDNNGRPPRGGKGKKVDVELRNGSICKNWAVDTTRWSLTANEKDPTRQFDVIKFKRAG